MDYERIYNNLINKRFCNEPDGYVEKHHIVPKCCGGDDNQDNIVKLTAREHYIAHLLLYKMQKYNEFKRSLAYAVHSMNFRDPSGNGHRLSFNRSYGLSKSIFSKEASKRMSEDNPFKGKHHTEDTKDIMRKKHYDVNGKNNPMFGRTHSDAAKEKISIANSGRLTGDSNPSKREDVREKISISKLGSLNPNSKKWMITSPDGNTTYTDGGLKRKLIELGTTYTKAKNHKSGWTIQEINCSNASCSKVDSSAKIL